MSTPTYEQDFYAWALESARGLRERRFADIDIKHIAEELEDRGEKPVARIGKPARAVACALAEMGAPARTEIARRWNAEGIPTLSGKGQWYRKTIMRMVNAE